MELKTYLEKRGANLALARKLGVSTVIISQWRTGARQIPAERCIDIERATSGLVRCEDMRPDIDWSFIRATDCPILGAGETAALPETLTRQAA